MSTKGGEPSGGCSVSLLDTCLEFDTRVTGYVLEFSGTRLIHSFMCMGLVVWYSANRGDTVGAVTVCVVITNDEG